MNDSRWGYWNVSNCDFQACVKSPEFMKPKVMGGQNYFFFAAAHDFWHGWLLPRECPALVLGLSSSASSVSVTSKELPACSTPLLLYLFTYRHVGQFHQDTLLPFGAVSAHSCVTYCCPVPFFFLVMWLHSIPYLCWSIFLSLLPLIINGCLSKSFIFFWFVVLIFFPLGPTRCLAACVPATNSPFPWQPLEAWKWGRNAPVTLVMTYYWYHNALHVTLISHVVVVVTA